MSWKSFSTVSQSMVAVLLLCVVSPGAWQICSNKTAVPPLSSLSVFVYDSDSCHGVPSWLQRGVAALEKQINNAQLIIGASIGVLSSIQYHIDALVIN
ncbi:hypothetical protein AMATHDRAFT_66397 [Amanita thiersii Skay4041]|uniref:Uncharacterized protein n=1 Tax=Amanita thiersii Skay4041 TaxID=703135 RepID=A0A2A9NFA5_9AGAR|nr:hypothetical protein AMATHDRAFT_66397 [Amanita thiersii Skay4041]